MDELRVLVDQLSELLSGTIEDSDEALELCQLAGMIARLDDSAPVLKRAAQWLEGSGAEMVEDGWCFFDTVEMMDALETLSRGELDPHAIEELVFDVDEWAAAAVWCGEQDAVRELVDGLTSAVRENPSAFSFMAKTASSMASSRAVAQDLVVYEFWMALADACPA